MSESWEQTWDKARQHGLACVDLRRNTIPLYLVLQFPENLAREATVLPWAERNGTLCVLMADPLDFETIDRMRFTLNRKIEVALAPREQIIDAIDRYYGGSAAVSGPVELT